MITHPKAEQNVNFGDKLQMHALQRIFTLTVCLQFLYYRILLPLLGRTQGISVLISRSGILPANNNNLSPECARTLRPSNIYLLGFLLAAGTGDLSGVARVGVMYAQ